VPLARLGNDAWDPYGVEAHIPSSSRRSLSCTRRRSANPSCSATARPAGISTLKSYGDGYTAKKFWGGL